MAKIKRKSGNWSLEDIKIIEKFIIESIAKGGTETDGKKLAAKHFGTNLNSIRVRWGRYKNGINVPEPAKKLSSSTVAEKVAAVRKSLVSVYEHASSAKKAGTRNWTKADIRQLKVIMMDAPTKDKGFIEASKLFNRSVNAIAVKWRKLGHKKSYSTPTHKNWIPKKNPPIDVIIDDGGIGNRRSLTLDIKEIKIDLLAQKLTIFY